MTAFALGAQVRLEPTRITKRAFEATTVTLPAMPNTNVTVVPEASGAITVWFDPPVVGVTGEWFAEQGKFTCCSPGGTCFDVIEAGGPDVWYGGIGKEVHGLERCRFSGGADFNIFSVIE